MIAKRLLGTQKAISPPAPAATDVYYDYRSLILNMQGASGSTTFLDESFNPLTVSAIGNAQLSADATFGTVASFDGTGDRLSIAINSRLDFRAGDFTMEAWVYPTSSSLYQAIFNLAYDTGGGLFFGKINNEYAIYGINNGTKIVSGGAVTLNTWQNVAITRKSGVFSIWLNGTSVATATNATAINLNNPVTIGGGYNGAYSFTGLIGPLRVSPWAVCKSNFTPSQELFPAVQDSAYANPYYDKVALQLKFDGTNGSTSFVDTGPNAFAVTPYGNAQITSASKYGSGAGTFDGSGDYLLVANNAAFNFGAGDFTVECWVKFATSISGVDYAITGQGTSAFTSNAGWIFARHNSNKLRFIFTDNGTSSYRICDTTSSFLPTVGTWYHLCAVKRSGVVTLYISGVNSGSASLNYSVYASTLNLGVGADSIGGIPLNGSIDELEITPGVAKYKANFTPPVRGLSTIYNPYTTLPVSGAALWLDGADSSTLFTDAGVTPVNKSGDLVYQWSDKSGNNRHATQATSGNRPTWVPPASGQNGLGVLSFNGTTNQLAGDQLRYTTNMSIEAVFKATSVSGTWRKIAAQSYASGWSVNPYFSWQLGLNNGYLHCGFSVTSNYLNNGLNSTGAISSNAWYHAVATFENGVFKLYINGSLNNSVDKSASGTTILNGSTGALTIGNSYSGVSEFFQGLMAHVSVYPQTLSSTDVATLYNYQKSKWGLS